MGAQTEYDFSVRQLIPASVAAFGLLAFAIFFAPVAPAQTHNASTSTDSSAHAAHVLVGAPQGFAQGNRAFSPAFSHPGLPQSGTNPGLLHPYTGFSGSHHPESGPHHPGHRPYPEGGVVYAPYPVYLGDQGVADDAAGQDAAQQMETEPEDSAPGPTIFDRRGSNQPSSVAEAAFAERMRDAQAMEPAPTQAAAEPVADPIPEQPQTVLVFKDKHMLEVQNYAIVGDMLYDMTPGRRTRIAIADLDLPATAKENDDRGIDFQLPAGPAAN